MFWLNNAKLAVAGCVLTFGMCAQARVTPVVLRDRQAAKQTFSEDRCVLLFLVTASREANGEGVRRQVMDSRTLHCLPASSAESLPAVFTCRAVQLFWVWCCKYDAQMQNAAGALSLCALHPGLLPWGSLAEWWGTAGVGKREGVFSLVMGTCLSSPLCTTGVKGFGHSTSEDRPKETVLSLSMNF